MILKEKQYFKKGDNIKVIAGTHKDKQGIIVKIVGELCKIRFSKNSGDGWVFQENIKKIDEDAKKQDNVEKVPLYLLKDYQSKTYLNKKLIHTKATNTKKLISKYIKIPPHTNVIITEVRTDKLKMLVFIDNDYYSFNMKNSKKLFLEYFKIIPKSVIITDPLIKKDIGKTLIARKHLKINHNTDNVVNNEVFIDKGNKVTIKSVTDNFVGLFYATDNVTINANNDPRELNKFFLFASPQDDEVAIKVQNGDIIKWKNNGKAYEVLDVKRTNNIINIKLQPHNSNDIIPVELSHDKFNSQFELMVIGYGKYKNQKEKSKKIKARRNFINCPYCKKDSSVEVFIDQTGQVIKPSKIKKRKSDMYECFNCDKSITDKNVDIHNLRKIKKRNIITKADYETKPIRSWSEIPIGTTVVLKRKEFDIDKGTILKVQNINDSNDASNKKWLELSKLGGESAWSGFYDIQSFNKTFERESIHKKNKTTKSEDSDLKFKKGDKIKLKYDWYGWKKGKELVIDQLDTKKMLDGSHTILLKDSLKPNMSTVVDLKPYEMDERFVKIEDSDTDTSEEYEKDNLQMNEFNVHDVLKLTKDYDEFAKNDVIKLTSKPEKYNKNQWSFDYKLIVSGDDDVASPHITYSAFVNSEKFLNNIVIVKDDDEEKIDDNKKTTPDYDLNHFVKGTKFIVSNDIDIFDKGDFVEITEDTIYSKPDDGYLIWFRKKTNKDEYLEEEDYTIIEPEDVENFLSSIVIQSNTSDDVINGKEIQKGDHLIFTKNYGKKYKMGDIVKVKKIVPSGYGGWQLELEGDDDVIKTHSNLKNNFFKYIDIVKDANSFNKKVVDDKKTKNITKAEQLQQDNVILKSKDKSGKWKYGELFNVLEFKKQTSQYFKGKYLLSLRPVESTGAKYIYYLPLNDIKKYFDIVYDSKSEKNKDSKVGKTVHPKDLKAGDYIKTVKSYRHIKPGEKFKVKSIGKTFLGWNIKLDSDIRTYVTIIKDKEFDKFVYAEEAEDKKEKTTQDSKTLNKYMMSKNWKSFNKGDMVYVEKEAHSNEYGADYTIISTKDPTKKETRNWVRYKEFSNYFTPIDENDKPIIIKTPVEQGDYVKFKKEHQRKSGDVLNTTTLWNVDSVYNLKRGKKKQTPGMTLELKKVHGGYQYLTWNVDIGQFFKEFVISENIFNVNDLDLGDVVKSKIKLNIINETGDKKMVEKGEKFSTIYFGTNNETNKKYIIFLSEKHPKYVYVCGYNDKAFNHAFKFVKKLKDKTKTSTWNKKELNIGDIADVDDVEQGDVLRTEKIYKGFRPDEHIKIIKIEKEDTKSHKFTFEVSGQIYKDIIIKDFAFRKNFVYAEKPAHGKKIKTHNYTNNKYGGSAYYRKDSTWRIEFRSYMTDEEYNEAKKTKKGDSRLLDLIEVGDIIENKETLELWIPKEKENKTYKYNKKYLPAFSKLEVVDVSNIRSAKGNKKVKVVPHTIHKNINITKNHLNSAWWSDITFGEVFKKTSNAEDNKNMDKDKKEQLDNQENITKIKMHTLKRGDVLISKKPMYVDVNGSRSEKYPAYTRYKILYIGYSKGDYKYITMRVENDTETQDTFNSGTYNNESINRNFYKIKE